MKHIKSKKNLIILISIGALMLLLFAYLHRFRAISQMISLDNVQEVSVFNGNKYYFTDEEAQDVLNRLDEIPMNKCLVTRPRRPSPPGWQYQIDIQYNDGTRADIVFIIAGVIEIYPQGEEKYYISGNIREEYVAFAKYVHGLAGWRWNWK